MELENNWSLSLSSLSLLQVLDATATHVQVELHARHKTVTVLLKDIKKLGGKEGRIEEAEQRDMGIHEQHDGIGFATKGNNTPGPNGMVGGSTPMGAGNNTPGGAFSFQETPLPQRQDAFAEQDYQVQMHQDDAGRRRDQQDQEHAYYDQQQQQQH